MISPEEAKKRAKENFLSGFNCAQSVLEVFCGELGIDRELALKSAQAFGGGTCRLREMCGALNGMLLALSIKNGSSDPKDKEAKDSVYKDGQFLCEKFKKRTARLSAGNFLDFLRSDNPKTTCEKIPLKEKQILQFQKKEHKSTTKNAHARNSALMPLNFLRNT